MIHAYPMLSRYVVPDMPSADELRPYLKQIDENRWYSNFGPLVTQFEDRMTMHLTGNGEAAAPLALTTVATCYHALQIGLQLLRLPENAKVLIPAVTFPACPLAVQHALAEPVLADVDAESWQLTPAIARIIAAKMEIHAVMPVAVYGTPVDGAGWDAFTEETGIPVIIDAAAALEAQAIPAKSLVAHSMHATKPFSIGEGGLLACRDGGLIEEARCISNFGTQLRVALQDGSNAKMSEYHGAVALAQMDRWEGIKQRRRVAYAALRRDIEKTGLDLRFQRGIERAIPSVLMLESPKEDAVAIVNAMNARHVMAHRMYLPPLYHHPHFSGFTVAGTEGKILPPGAAPEERAKVMENSESLQRRLFGLPMHPFITDGDRAYMIGVLTETVERHGAR